MNSESRVQKSILNAKVNVFFYLLSLLLAFFSRKIFLDCLGADFVGLTGTIGNLLAFLNLAELGVGTAISYVLYTPLFEKNKEKIKQIISTLGYLYCRIGYLILIGGVILGCFLPMIFRNAEIALSIIFLSYIVFLVSSLITYFINYRQTLLSADQKYYIVSSYSQSVKLIKSLVQMGVTYYTQNYYYWIILELLFNIIYCVVLNRKIRHIYPWLTCGAKEGKQYLILFPEIKIKIKQIFIQKIAFLIQERGIPFLIFVFASLQTVAYYGNYTLITIAVSSLLYQALESFNSGVGNLIAEGKKDKIIQVFWEIFILRFYVTSIFSIVIVLSTHSFIAIWLGEKYVLSNTILVLIIADMFIRNTRGALIQFTQGYGLFDDTWAAYVESAINLGLALFLGYFYGIKGVLLGGVIGMFIIAFGWKPYYLFKRGIKIKLKPFYLESLKYIFAFGICCSICYYLQTTFNLTLDNIYSWGIYTIVVTIIASLLLGCTLYLLTNHFKILLKRLKRYE